MPSLFRLFSSLFQLCYRLHSAPLFFFRVPMTMHALALRYSWNGDRSAWSKAEAEEGARGPRRSGRAGIKGKQGKGVMTISSFRIQNRHGATSMKSMNSPQRGTKRANPNSDYSMNQMDGTRGLHGAGRNAEQRHSHRPIGLEAVTSTESGAGVCGGHPRCVRSSGRFKFTVLCICICMFLLCWTSCHARHVTAYQPMRTQILIL